ncbi:LCP family protein [Patescibacteria group bacterium]|nr:LCP family protein [Patescibacteria group bacterium]
MGESNYSSTEEKYPKVSIRKWFRWSLLGFLAFIFLVLFTFGLNFYIKGPRLNYLSLAKNFLFTAPDDINLPEARTNILVLGKGGMGHEAPDLTDTIIFISLAKDGGGITTVSLPRDIWITKLRTKLNSIYYWGEKTDEGGLKLAKEITEEITGEPIKYALIIDFIGFTEIVDILGGIEVNIKESFTDPDYPIAGRENDDCGGDKEFRCRYEIVSFEEGWETMDGERALKYVRSRKAEGEEGTDLSRAERQQVVIGAIKEEIFSFSTLTSPTKIRKLWNAILETVEVDIPESVAPVIARMAFDSRNDIAPYVLGEDLLVNPPKLARYDYLYVYIPKAGGWEEVHSWVDSLVK